MGNRAYLTCADVDHVYPCLGASYDPKRHTVVACDGCVPLVWLVGFGAADLRTEILRFAEPKRELRATAPLCRREAFVRTVERRRAFLNGVFRDNGGLDVAMDALLAHLARFPGTFVSIEYEEVAALHSPEAFDVFVADVLRQLDAEDPACRAGLVALSTVVADRPFLAFEQAAASEAEQDRWNVFRLLGSEWLVPTAWDFVAENRALYATINQNRLRDAFGLYLDEDEIENADVSAEGVELSFKFIQPGSPARVFSGWFPPAAG